MAQNGNVFTSFWMNTATAPGTPLTGLSATINIRELIAVNGIVTGSILVVNAQNKIELGGGWYSYTFVGYNNTKDYVYDCNPGVTAYRESGVTDRRLDYIDKNVSDIASNGGGGGFASQAIQTSIGNLGRKMDKKIEDEHEKTREFIARENSETSSHIELAKSETIRTIDSIEQTEIDTSDIIAGIGVIRAQNTKLAKYLKGEDDKEKAEIEKNHKKMMDDIESAYNEMEKENGKIIEEKESEKTSIMKDADEIIQAIEDEKIEISEKNKSEMINKIKTLI